MNSPAKELIRVRVRKSSGWDRYTPRCWNPARKVASDFPRLLFFYYIQIEIDSVQFKQAGEIAVGLDGGKCQWKAEP